MRKFKVVNFEFEPSFNDYSYGVYDGLRNNTKRMDTTAYNKGYTVGNAERAYKQMMGVRK